MPANLDCIHCGICLSVCPTYFQLGSEADSPRGRIYLINAMQQGRISPAGAAFQRHMHLCLECRACETACPSGVGFSLMMNNARAKILEHKRVSLKEALLRRLIFRTILPSRRRLHFCFRLLRAYQRSGLQTMVRGLGILRLFSSRLAGMESLLPDVPPSFELTLPETAPPDGKRRVSLFLGCIMPELFLSVHEATVRVLRHNRVTVGSPTRQACCGALHLHDGEMESARELARKNIEAFENDGADFIVVNAAGCGAMLKEYGHLLHDDAKYAGRAAAFSARVRDVSEFLDDLGIGDDLGRLEIKVTYDDPCHLIHGQGIKAAPRNLLGKIPGLEFTELADADRCCGSAGVYNITEPAMSARILEDKIRNIVRSGAQVVASGNPGCLLQIQQGLRAKGLAINVVHPIELLDSAYDKGKKDQAAGSPGTL